MGKAIVSRGHSVEIKDKDAVYDKGGKLITPVKSRSVGQLQEFEADDSVIAEFRRVGAVMTEEQADAYRKAEEDRKNTPREAAVERTYGGALEGHVANGDEPGTVFEGAADGTVANKGGTQAPVEPKTGDTSTDDKAKADKAAADKAAAEKAAADKLAAEKASADAAAARTQSAPATGPGSTGTGTQAGSGTAPKSDPLA